MQLTLWNNDYELPKKTLAKKLMESRVVYNIDRNTNSDMSVLLTALLGNIPDETMTELISKKLPELMEMTRDELLELKGITPKLASRVIAVFEIHKMLLKTKAESRPVIKSPEDVANLLTDEMRFLDREQFRAVLVNTKNHVLAVETISIGTLNSSSVHPRELFKSAIKRSAAAIILVHNHPSGEPTPSREDIEVTKRLQEAGDIIGIKVLDHIVIGNGSFISLKAKGFF